MKLKSEILLIGASVFPFKVVSSCSDRTNAWVIGSKTKRWCVWARNVEGATQHRCALKDLYEHCPIACGSCPTTAPSSSCSCDTLAYELRNIKKEVEKIESIEKKMDIILDLLLSTAAPTPCPSTTLTPTVETSPTNKASTDPTHESSTNPTLEVSYTPTPQLSEPVIAGGRFHSCAINRFVKLFCWGWNDFGQLGTGNLLNSNTPVEIELESSPSEISLGYYHSCILDALSKVLCWGGNNFGQLGSGDNIDHKTPNEVSLNNDAVKVSAGNFYTCIIDTQWKVWCWGRNVFGQLGIGNSGDQNTPTEISGLSNGASDISLGNTHACMIDKLFKLFCFGRNQNGQLGLGNYSNKNTPNEVIFNNNHVLQLSSGGEHTCIIDNLSQVWCWGRNYLGQVGDGGTTSLLTLPTQISLVNVASRIDLGGEHSCMVDNLSNLWCWGSNAYGQLGLGNTPHKYVPTKVIAVDHVTQVSLGHLHTLLVDDNGNIMSMGRNNYGQLGLGDNTDRNTPTLLTGL